VSEALSQSQAELFASLSADWWDEDGPFRPLHAINPPRLAFIRDQACAHFGRDPKGRKPLAGLRALDIGCGGGLLCEPLARLGATVTGIDAVAENIEAARAHAEDSGLTLAYEVAAPEELAARGLSFDLVINMEVIEHASDPEVFMAAACALVADGGAMAASTLNRTIKSLAFAKIGAEYLLRWLPAGTHDWRSFVKPSELARHLRAGGMTLTGLQGIGYNPAAGTWSLVPDVGVNYLVFAKKA